MTWLWRRFSRHDPPWNNLCVEHDRAYSESGTVELAPRRVAKVGDVVKEGDQVKVKVLSVDDRGKVRLSMKAVDQATGEDISQKDQALPRRSSRSEGSAAIGPQELT